MTGDKYSVAQPLLRRGGVRSAIDARRGWISITSEHVWGAEAVMTDQSSAKSLLNIGLCRRQLQLQINGLFPSKHGPKRSSVTDPRTTQVSCVNPKKNHPISKQQEDHGETQQSEITCKCGSCLLNYFLKKNDAKI